MKRFQGWKRLVLTGTLVASFGVLAGCEKESDDEGRGERPRLESVDDQKTTEVPEDGNGTNDDGSGIKETEVKEGAGKEDGGNEAGAPVTVSDASGYDSTEDVILALWEGFADCSEEQLYSCFLDENVISARAFKKIEEVVDSQYQVALNMKDSIVVHTDKITMDTESIEPEKLPSHITNIVEVEEANISTVVIPFTQTYNGTDYEVNENYEISTIFVNGKWYVDTVDSLGADVISQSGDASGSSAVSDSSDWCTYENTKTGIRVVYGTGMDDSCELARGVTFGDICDAFEKNSDDFDRETFRQIMTLSFGPENYLAALQKSDAAAKAHAIAMMAELAHTIDKVDGSATEMTADLSAPNVSVFKVSTPAYGACTFTVDGNTGEMQLTQDKTGNVSEGELKDADVAVWEQIAKEVLGGK